MLLPTTGSGLMHFEGSKGIANLFMTLAFYLVCASLFTLVIVKRRARKQRK